MKFNTFCAGLIMEWTTKDDSSTTTCHEILIDDPKISNDHFILQLTNDNIRVYIREFDTSLRFIKILIEKYIANNFLNLGLLSEPDRYNGWSKSDRIPFIEVKIERCEDGSR